MASVVVRSSVLGGHVSGFFRGDIKVCENALSYSGFHGAQIKSVDCHRYFVSKPKTNLVVARSTEKAAERNKGKDSEGPPGNDSIDKKKSTSIDRIEMQAKSSIERLKDILYKLKSRPLVAENSQNNGTASVDSDEVVNSSAPVINKEQELYISQKIEVDLSTDSPTNTEVSLEMDAEAYLDPDTSNVEVSFPKPGFLESSVQLDAITYTNTTVQFDEETQTAIVTVSATVREADLGDQVAYAERAVAMATRALARTCLALDEKAQLAVLAKSPLSVSPSTALSQHKEILRQLSVGQVVGSEALDEESGSTPFRQGFRVVLADESGSEVEAVFKPMVPGDKYNRWARAPADWVAYQMASLLGADVVPPAVMRRGLKVGGKVYSSGVMVYMVDEVKALEDVPSELWGEPSPSAMVSNVHILDALLGSAPRKKEAFKAGRHWAGAGEVRPCLLDHPMGPGLGELHSMWSRRGDRSHGVDHVSQGTLLKLKALSRGSLLEAMSGGLTAGEVEVILEKRDQLVAYFDALASRLGMHSVVSKG